MKSRYARIDQLADEASVAVLCELLGVARSGYYAWRRSEPGRRAQANEALMQQIEQVFEQSRRTYGSPRVTAELRQQGHRCNHKRVERLMREKRLRARPRRRWRPRTTESRHDQPIAPNLLPERGRPQATNQVWVSDITYLRTAEGWLYLAAVMDLYSRRVIGWSMQEHLETQLPLTALAMALQSRVGAERTVHHSDRGCQYASQAYRAALAKSGLEASMSRSGNCFDNAAMESFWSTLKSEGLLESEHWSKAQVRQRVFDYIEAFYNRKRLHSSLGYRSPVDFEQQTK